MDTNFEYGDQSLPAKRGEAFAGDGTGEPRRWNESNGLYQAALARYAAGYNVVPYDPINKHPTVTWKELQDRRVTQKELAQWKSRFSKSVGFITGAINSVIVIESDGPEGERSPFLSDVALIDIGAVSAVLGRSKASIWRDVGNGRLAAPVKAGHSTCWRLGDARGVLKGGRNVDCA
jgi:hypothetical protein